MRLAILTILLGVLSFTALATPPLKPFVVSYNDNTPQSVIDQAMDAVRAAKGRITHEYKLIKGFAASAPRSVFEQIQTLGENWGATVEEDNLIRTNDDQSGR
ncbi:MAG: hypothetical protein M1825_001861 [Sarcosagium campestre]|nr:MAG: hypothetical protein M1825_001861 [Sarcosagium campestre]